MSIIDNLCLQKYLKIIWKTSKENRQIKTKIKIDCFLLLKENTEAWSSPYCLFLTLDNWEICNSNSIEYFFLKFLDKDIINTKNNRNYCNSFKTHLAVIVVSSGKQTEIKLIPFTLQNLSAVTLYLIQKYPKRTFEKNKFLDLVSIFILMVYSNVMF